jgi:hypothetical protein
MSETRAIVVEMFGVVYDSRRHERERSPNTWRPVLSPEQAAEIRRRYAAGRVSYRSLAEDFGLNKNTIGMVVRRETW